MNRHWMQGLELSNKLSIWVAIKLRATSHTRLRARDHYTWSTLIGGNGRPGPSSLHTTLEGPTEYTSECKMDVKFYMDSYMVLSGSCFMVTWTIFRTHLLEIGLTQNWETMALQILTTVDLFYSNDISYEWVFKYYHHKCQILKQSLVICILPFL